VSPVVEPPIEADTAPRYAIGERLWLGTRTEIVAAHDPRVDRAVAVKRLLGTPAPGDVERFLHEASVQGRLEHPAVVPVLDVGVDEVGRPYLVMRQVRGATLAHAIERRLAGDREAEERFPVRRLLGAFVDVCLAVEYAHALEIVHDDLRTANVLLGDFGEVYLLEWARARKLGEGDAANDVAALGAILSRIVTGRFVAPELLDACAAAEARELTSARELAAIVQRWLDGVRDVRRRRELGTEHRERARAAFTAGDAATAMAEARSAIALDPGDVAAGEILGRLVLTPPSEDSPEAAAAIRASDHAEMRSQAKIAALSYLAVPAFVPLLLWPGVLPGAWPVLVLLALTGASLIGLALLAATDRIRERWVWTSILGNVVLISLFARVCSPLLAVPAMVVTLTMTAMTVPTLRPWWLVPVVMAFPSLGMWGLEALGVLEATIWTTGSAIVVTSDVIHLPQWPAFAVLALHSTTLILVAGHYTWRLSHESREARIRLLSQAWHLEQLATTKPTS
jgi:serine/threonine-protein kinase